MRKNNGNETKRKKQYEDKI